MQLIVVLRARRLPALALALVVLAGPGAARAAERVPGPVPAEVLSVIDGDTIAVRARVWPGHSVEVNVRLSGIDAPERRGRCAAERDLAVRAGDWLRARVGGQILLSDVRLGKYAGRVIARVALTDGTDPGAGLVAAGLARAYDGGPRFDWCAELTALPAD